MKNPINTLSVMIALAFGNTALAEKPHSSTSVIQINPSQIIIPANSNGSKALFTAVDMEKEMNAVTSPEVLQAALKSMDPDGEVDDRALAEVREKITLNPRRGTDFVEITVEDSDPTKATNLARALADTFIKQRAERETQRAKSALKALDEELTQQGELVKEARANLTVLIKKYGIPYVDGRKNPIHPGLLASLESVDKSHQLRLAASADLPDNPVAPLYKNYLEALEDHDQLGFTFRHRHPKMIEAKKRINESRKLANEAIPKLIELLNNEQPSDGEGTVELSLKQLIYNQAKKDYEQSRDMFREMKIKQQEARVLLKMPRSPVTLHERAK